VSDGKRDELMEHWATLGFTAHHDEVMALDLTLSASVDVLWRHAK
jgi:hypothetical protein